MTHLTTVRRDWLKRQIIKGNIEIKTDMILTDDYAFDNAYNCQKSGWRKANIESYTDQDFKYSYGALHKNEDGTLSWTMLCNHYYTCRLINQS